MFIHAVCHRLTAVAQWPLPLCRVTALAVPISGYGGAAFGLLRQKYRPPVTENPLPPCRNARWARGETPWYNHTANKGANDFSTHRLIPSYTHYSIFFFIL